MSVATTHAAQSAAAATAATTSATDASRGQIASNFNDFLKLLTTQLQNQDPTSPLDTNQFTSQLVQFASVEQQINMNKSMDQLITLTLGQQLSQASAMLGATVEVDADSISLQGGQGQVRFDASEPGTYRVAVLDAAGRTVRQDTVGATQGMASWTWDGRDVTGRAMPDGAYRTVVTRLGTDGTTTQVPFSVIATATGAERSGNTLELALGGLRVGFDKVRQLVAPAKAG